MLRLAEIVAVVQRIDPPIVHRDLKPANILVKRTANGEIAYKITDFGIGGIASSRAIQASRKATSPSQFLTTAVRGSGSYLYASPEQFEGKDPDPRDDVYALGVIWYQMMTGNLNRGPSVGQGWRRRFLDQGLSAGLLELLGACFEEQEDRPADAAVLAEKLAALLSPPVVEVKNHESSGRTRREPVKVSEPPKERTPTLQKPELDEALEPPKEIVNSIGMNLRLIPAGKFDMGSPDSDEYASGDEKPQHPVRITRPFYLGVYPVTHREYMQFMRKNPSHFSGDQRLPVECVSWIDAAELCNALSRKEGLPLFYRIKGQTSEIPDWNGIGYRLPTEAEWEYACRAGSSSRYCFGDDEESLGRYAWYSANSGRKTHPVGEKNANAFGLHDMHGNVW